jgi:hypothetical protein
MRYFETVDEALSEIKRDIAKGSHLTFTRVQNKEGLELPGRERIGYSYSIEGGWPEYPEDLVKLGVKHGLQSCVNHGDAMQMWLGSELRRRLDGEAFPLSGFSEVHNPYLAKTMEGSVPSYTYHERMMGAVRTLTEALVEAPDSRRAYWPMFTQSDAGRASMPTRVPCSLGWQIMIREIPNRGPHSICIYDQRSADFDRFFISDIWFAHKLQQAVTEAYNSQLGPSKQHKDVQVGQFIHFVHSLHSFDVENEEIY